MASRHLAHPHRRKPAERRGWKRLHLPANGDLLNEVKRLQSEGLVFDFDSRNRLIVPNSHASARSRIQIPKNAWVFLAVPGVLLAVGLWPTKASVVAEGTKPVIHKVQCADEVQKLAITKVQPDKWVTFGGVQLQNVSVACEKRTFRMQVIKSSKTLRALRLN